MADYNGYTPVDDGNQLLDWDSTFDYVPEFTIFEPGIYDFEVVSFERQRHVPQNGGKLPECNKAVVKLLVSDGINESKLTENFYLVKKCEWRISSFFVSLGLIQENEPVNVKLFEKAMGCTGKLKLKKSVTTNGNERNEIERFLKPEAPKPAPTTNTARNGWGR